MIEWNGLYDVMDDNFTCIINELIEKIVFIQKNILINKNSIPIEFDFTMENKYNARTSNSNKYHVKEFDRILCELNEISCYVKKVSSGEHIFKYHSDNLCMDDNPLYYPRNELGNSSFTIGRNPNQQKNTIVEIIRPDENENFKDREIQYPTTLIGSPTIINEDEHFQLSTIKDVYDFDTLSRVYKSYVNIKPQPFSFMYADFVCHPAILTKVLEKLNDRFKTY